MCNKTCVYIYNMYHIAYFNAFQVLANWPSSLALSGSGPVVDAQQQEDLGEAEPGQPRGNRGVFRPKNEEPPNSTDDCDSFAQQKERKIWESLN